MAAATPIGLLLALALGAGVELRDDVGRSVVLAETPQRIVSLAPANTELLFALGVGGRVVGDTTWCTYPEAAKALPKIGDFVSIDLEKVLALEPDLVVATWLAQQRWVEALEKLGLKVLVIYPENLDAIMSSIGLLGRAVGREQAAAELVEDLRGRLARLDARVSLVPVELRPSLFVALTTRPLYTVGPGSSLDEVVRRAGAVNVFADLGSAYASVSPEAVVQRDPEVILVAHTLEEGEGERIVAAHPGLRATRAGRTGRVIDSIDPALLVHPNHRLVEGIEALHAALFPAEP